MPLEKQIVRVILDHPEYQALFEKPQPDNEPVYFPELGQPNPFLHMGLHLAIRDQLATNRPDGIQDLYHQLLSIHQDSLEVEHRLMDKLAESLWQAQRDQTMLDEAGYLASCRLLLNTTR